MKNLIFVLSSLLLLSLVSSDAQAHESLAQRDVVSVSGNGEIEAEPDQATLQISVTATADDLVSAKAMADDRYRRVQSVIKKAGIEDKHVKVIQLYMQPEYEWESGKQRYRGEKVSRSLSVVVNDLDKLAGLMQALVENKVSSVDNISTGFKERRALVNQALALAAQDAKEKAAFLATQLDRDIGVAIEINEHNTNTPLMRQQNVEIARGAAMAKSSEPAPAEMFGTQKVSASVTVKFELK